MVDKCTQTNVFPLLDLPQVVIDKVISFLPPATCLTLRQVCRTTHDWITNQSCTPLEVEKWTDFVLDITGKAPQTFSTVVKMNLPITVFHLRNGWSKHKIYESEGVEEFLERYKKRNVSFIVDALFMFQYPNEYKFYSSLENVSGLRVTKLRIDLAASPQNGQPTYEEFIRRLRLPPPSTLISSLRALVIKDFEHYSLPNDIFTSFLTSFKNLVHLSPPAKLEKIRWSEVPWFFLCRKSTYCPTWTGALATAILENEWCINKRPPTVRGEQAKFTLDLAAFMQRKYIQRSYMNYIRKYVQLLQESHRHGFLLRSIYSPLVESMYRHWQGLEWSSNEIQESLKFLDCVVSLFGVSNVLRFGFCEMKKLEEISIIHHFGYHQWLYHDPPELSWAALKTLKVTVYITEDYFTQFGKRVWEVAFRKIFENAKRKSVTSLTLNVNMDSEVEDMMFEEDIFLVPVIFTNFTRLQSLTIHGWNAPNECFRELFSNLTSLSYINVAACGSLEDSAFECLSVVKTVILDLDRMPQFTEHLFTQYLSCMPLKELQIISTKPVRQLTIRAIVALQEGTFGSTIEKFPFDTWKSKYITEKDKVKLSKGFRCIV